MTKTNYRQGDVVLLPYPFTDLSATKKRPVVILSRDEVNRELVIVAKITSVARNDEFTFEIRASDLDIPLSKRSEVRTNEVFTAHKSLIIKKISRFKKPSLALVAEQVKSHISVP